jgi:hypothetical protein
VHDSDLFSCTVCSFFSLIWPALLLLVSFYVKLNIISNLHRFLSLHQTVNPYLDKGLNEFQRLILFSQFFTIFGGIMYHMVSLSDKLLEIEETPSKRRERDIIAVLIVAINLVSIGIYPIYRMIAVASGFKGDVLYFSLRDTVQNLTGGRVKESHSNVQIFTKSKNLLKEAHQLGCPPEPISHSNHRGALAPRPALLEPVYISTQISGDMVYKIGTEDSFRV